MKNWEQIRIQWVNGNRSDVKAEIARMSKAKLLSILLQACERHFEYLDLSAGCMSGDMTDLIEILRATSKGGF
jgi:hypothetical protein